MIQVKKRHSSIDNVIKNTPTSLDMFLQTNLDKIKQNCNENHSWGFQNLHRFESADVRLCTCKCQNSFLGQSMLLSHLMCLTIFLAFGLYDTEKK